MKLDFKRVMSSVLAFVMLFSSLVMVNVVNVSAADQTYYFYNDVNTESKFTSSSSMTNNDGIVSNPKFTFTGDSSETTFTKTVKMNSSATIQFAVTGTATVEVIWAPRADKTANCSIQIVDGSGTQKAKSDSVTGSTSVELQKLSASGLEKGTYTVKRISGESLLYGIKVVDTISDSAVDYTVNGTVTGAVEGDVLKIDNHEATVTGNSVTYKIKSDTKPYQAGSSTVTVTSPSQKYQDTTATVESYEDASNTYTLSPITLTPQELKELEAGTYTDTDIKAGMPNFDLSKSTSFPSEQHRLQTGTDSISFKLKDNAKIEITYKGASSDKSAYAGLYKEESTEIATGTTVTNTEATITASGLSAGTYSIKSTAAGTSGTSVRVNKIVVSYDTSIETSSETTSKEEVDETSSETTTAAPVLGDYVAVPYNINFNKTTGNAGEKMNAAGITDLRSATLDNIEYTLNSSYALKNGAPSADYIKVKNGSIKFSVDQSVYLKIDIVNSNRTLNIKDATGKTYGPITDTNDTEAILIPAGSYTLSDTGSEVQISEIDISPAKTYKVKISGNNELSNEVTVSIADKTFQAASGSYEASLELAAGTHELSAPGCMFDPHEITVKDQEEEQSFTVNIKESKTVTVKFNFSEGSADPKDNSGSKAAPITITNLTTNESKEIKTKSDVAEFTDVAPKTAFKFTSLSANTWKFLSRRAGVVDTSENHDWKADIGFLNGKTEATRYFVYTVPNTITSGTEYGVEFTAEEDIRGFTLAGNRNSQGNAMTSGQTLSFGQYGFGQDKVNSCGKDARDYVDYVFEVAGLNDYINGRYSADIFVGKILPSYGSDAGDLTAFSQYGILNEYQEGKDTYIRFKVSSDLSDHEKGKIKALVDDAGDITVYDITNESGPEDHDHNESKKVTVTTVAGTSKQSFVIEAGHTYEIIANTSDTSHKEYYIKSIRILNPDNIFDTPESDPDGAADGENKVTGYKEASIPAEIKAALDQQPAPGETLFRVIGQITLSGDDAKSEESASAALSNIKAVGFDMFEKDYYDKNDTNDFVADGYHLRGASTTKDEAPIKYTEIVAADDIVNTAVDLSTDQSQIIGSTAPSSFDKVYCQTFIATSTSKVLVPWVKYVTDPDTKVYTLVPITETSPDKLNNIVLDINKAS